MDKLYRSGNQRVKVVGTPLTKAPDDPLEICSFYSHNPQKLCASGGPGFHVGWGICTSNRRPFRIPLNIKS